MKEPKWEQFETSKELLESATVIAEDADEDQEILRPGSNRSRVTEMRRRIEERLDSKRIALQCDYLQFDDLAGGLDDFGETPDSLQ